MRRRHFLKAAGLTLTLPALESLGGAVDLEDAPNIKRFFLMTDGYGFHTPYFYPTKTGKGYAANDVLKPLEPLRREMTIVGGLQHLSGHAGQKFVSTGSPASAHFGDSVDQVAARHLSQRVPIDALLLSTRQQATGGSFRGKVPVAMLYDPEETFDALFAKGDVKARQKRLAHQQSTLDLCLTEAKALSREVSMSDRQRLDDYFNSIRETEQLVQKETRFLHAPPIDPGMTKDQFVASAGDHVEGEKYDAFLRSQMKFVELAFKFDLTRVAYLWEHGRMHGATHHGHREGSLRQLKSYAISTTSAIAECLTAFKNTKMSGGNTLLDETLFVWAAALGSAAGHTGRNAPAMLAGGRLKHHGRYVHFNELQPLPKLHLTVLQQLGVPAENFSDSNSTLTLV